MKSRLFSRFDPEHEKNKSLRQHLRVFLGLTESQRSACITALGDFVLADTAEPTRQVLERLEQQIACTGVEVNQCLGVLAFFLDRMQARETREDSTQQWADDLVDADFLASQQVPGFVECIELVRRDVLPQVQAELARRQYATGVFPSLKQFGTTVEMRAVQADRFRWGNAIAEYKPSIDDVVPVASVHIGVDAGLQEDFYFQVDKREIQLVIDSLTAAKADMEALERLLPFTPSQQDSE